MRVYAGVVGAIAFAAWSCQLSTNSVCVPGEDRCACVHTRCDEGLTCVSGTCFNLSAWFGAAGSGAGALASGTAGVGMNVLPSATPSTAGVACAADGGDCTAAACCEGGVCVLGVCAARCSTHQDCASGCCLAHDANLAACFDASACATPTACTPPGADCSALGCCEGAPCVNNVCAADCTQPADCASACCIALTADASPTCALARLCQPGTP